MRGSSSWADEAEREDAERKQRSPEEKKKVNPFGDAKPREVVLEEKGVDWRKKDMELQRRSVSRPECEEEKKLKDEIRALEEIVKSTVGNDCGKGGGDGKRADAEYRESLEAQLAQKENELQQLTLSLDDKIRFPQRSVDRPTFRSGYLDSDTGPDSRKRGFQLEPLDLGGSHGPEMPGSLHSRGGMLSISNGEWLPGVTSRAGDFTRGLESERQGSFSGRGNTTRSQNSRSYRQGSHLEHGELARRYDAGRPGARSGNGNSFQGNGQERPGSHSGRLDVIRRNDSEKMSSFSGNSDQGHYAENLGLGSWHSDVLGWESGRRTYVSGGSGYDSDRHGSRSEQEFDVKGYGFERAGICGGYDEIPKNHRNERPGSRSGRRDFLRPCDAECLGSPCGHVEAEMCGAFHERCYSTSGKRNTGRPVSIFDSGRLGPLPPGQPDIGRGHGPPYRGSGGRASGRDQDSSGREYRVVQQHDRRGRQHNGMQQDNRRGREYRGIQQHDRRQVSLQQNKFDQTRGIRDDHLDYY